MHNGKVRHSEGYGVDRVECRCDTYFSYFVNFLVFFWRFWEVISTPRLWFFLWWNSLSPEYFLTICYDQQRCYAVQAAYGTLLSFLELLRNCHPEKYHIACHCLPHCCWGPNAYPLWYHSSSLPMTCRETHYHGSVSYDSWIRFLHVLLSELYQHAWAIEIKLCLHGFFFKEGNLPKPIKLWTC